MALAALNTVFEHERDVLRLDENSSVSLSSNIVHSHVIALSGRGIASNLDGEQQQQQQRLRCQRK